MRPTPSRSLFRKTALRASLVGLFLGAGLAATTDEIVVEHPGRHIAQDAIERSFTHETLQLYAIPTTWQVAIVAAEDQRFWTHGGFDVLGSSRATVANLAAGEAVAGGSSLTQQTAKVLFGRERSWRGKGVELLNAMRLEAHYDKSEILGFYANSVYFAHGQYGLSAGASYHFDTDPQSLSVVQAAFLAGMMKAPARMDRDPEYATARTRHILERIVAVPAEALTAPRGATESWGDHDQRVEEVREIQAEAVRLLEQGIALDRGPRKG